MDSQTNSVSKAAHGEERTENLPSWTNCLNILWPDGVSFIILVLFPWGNNIYIYILCNIIIYPVLWISTHTFSERALWFAIKWNHLAISSDYDPTNLWSSSQKRSPQSKLWLWYFEWFKKYATGTKKKKNAKKHCSRKHWCLVTLTSVPVKSGKGMQFFKHKPGSLASDADLKISWVITTHWAWNMYFIKNYERVVQRSPAVRMVNF